MRKTKTIFSIGVVWLISGYLCFGQEKKPNIIWVVAEDLSALDLPAYGNSILYTPILDSLAAAGTVFKRAYATSAVCAPSRSALMVGRYQTVFGAAHMKLPERLFPALPDSVFTVMELFNANGYQTLYRGRSNEGGLRTIDKSSHWMFQRRDGMRSSCNSLDQLQPDIPFFGVFDFTYAHRPFSRDTIKPVDKASISLPPYYPEGEIVREDWKLYFESIQWLDRQLAVLFNELRHRGLSDNTVIVFCSDHGRPMTRSKYWMYESGLHVPLIISMPAGFSRTLPEESTAYPVSLLDLVPTSLAMAGIKIPAYCDGRNLFESVEDRKLLFAASDRISELHLKARAVITGRFKYIRNDHDTYFASVNAATTAYGKANYPVYHVIDRLDSLGKLSSKQKQLVDSIPYEQLFDLIADPYEVNNLANVDQYRHILDSLRSALVDWQRVNDRMDYYDSEEVKAYFQDLGKNTQRANRPKAIRLRSHVYNRMQVGGSYIDIKFPCKKLFGDFQSR